MKAVKFTKVKKQNKMIMIKFIYLHVPFEFVSRPVNIMAKSPNYAESQIEPFVPQILWCVHHQDWLNMVQNKTRLAQFSQKV